jgi:hypothetical protein
MAGFNGGRYQRAVDATGHFGAGPVGTDHGTARHWDRWAVAMWQLLIDPCVAFAFKFDRLN